MNKQRFHDIFTNILFNLVARVSTSCFHLITWLGRMVIRAPFFIN